MFRKKMTALAVLVSLMLLVVTVPAQAAPFWKGSHDGAEGHDGHGPMQNWRDFGRLFGQDRFGTSVRIDEDMYPDQVQNVVLASGDGYADALSASVLAHQKNAPIILVNNGVKGSSKALAYVKEHLVKGGHVFIVGGRGVVTYNLAELLRQLGYVITRLGGVDRYQTDTLVAQQLNVPLHTPIIIASGENYPDALGISSVAASNGWPILLSGPNALPQCVRDFVSNDQPSQTYIIGGTGVISTKVQEQVQSVAPGTAITRLGGADRFATLADILFKFFPDPTQIYVANGYGFADALAGSPLAANHNAPILLVNPNSNSLPTAIVTYLLMLQAKGIQPQVATLGGTAAVPDAILQDVANILNGQYPQGGGVPTPTTITESLTVSNPSTTGFTVSLSPALNGLTSGNFTLLNGSGSAVPITSVATGDNGATYSIGAALTAGQTYMLTATDTGYAFGGTYYVTVPAAAVSVTTSVYGPSTTGFTLDLSPAVPGLTASNFTLSDGSGNPVAITGATTANNGAAYQISASLTSGQTYVVTTSAEGYTFGGAQYVTVPAVTASESLTVSNPSTTGFTVSLSPALNGLTSGNFTLLNGLGSAVPITSVATGDNGATYSIGAVLTAGQTYMLTTTDTGYAFGGTHYVTVPAAAVSVTTSVYGPSTTGFTLDLSPAVPDLTASNFTLSDGSGNPVAITGATTANNGAAYQISASLTSGQTYVVTTSAEGYTFGGAQYVTVPAVTASESLTVSNPSTTGFTVSLSPALNGLTSGNFTLLNGSGSAVPITSVATGDNGATYSIGAVLTAGQTYTLTASDTGYTFGTAQSVVVPQS